MASLTQEASLSQPSTGADPRPRGASKSSVFSGSQCQSARAAQLNVGTPGIARWCYLWGLLRRPHKESRCLSIACWRCHRGCPVGLMREWVFPDCMLVGEALLHGITDSGGLPFPTMRSSGPATTWCIKIFTVFRCSVPVRAGRSA